MTRATERSLSRPLRIALFISGLVVLLVSWWALFVYLAAWTEGILAPWDVDKRALPPISTFPRTVNDFFEGSGWWLPAGITVLLSACLTSARLRRAGSLWARVPWESAATNLGFGLLLFLVGYPAGMADSAWRARFGLPDVPHFYLLDIGVALLLWVAYLNAQRRGFTRKYSRPKFER